MGRVFRQEVVIIFGARSPLVVELEESLERLGIEPRAAISISGTPRLINRSLAIDLENFRVQEGDAFITCAFSPKRRCELAEMARSLGIQTADAVIDPTAVVPRSLRIGSGSYVNAGVVIGALTYIGDHVLVNRSASIGHHCLIDDLVSIGPGATLAGNIKVGRGTVIGAGAVILPDLRIGCDAVIAAGAVVRKNVPDSTLVAGNAAKIKSFIPIQSSLNVEGGE
jgi:sugar O-acyltransferase (sialic acid O-acetyltransferase NeuD family)